MSGEKRENAPEQNGASCLQRVEFNLKLILCRKEKHVQSARTTPAEFVRHGLAACPRYQPGPSNLYCTSFLGVQRVNGASLWRCAGVPRSSAAQRRAVPRRAPTRLRLGFVCLGCASAPHKTAGEPPRLSPEQRVSAVQTRPWLVVFLLEPSLLLKCPKNALWFSRPREAQERGARCSQVQNYPMLLPPGLQVTGQGLPAHRLGWQVCISCSVLIS